MNTPTTDNSRYKWLHIIVSQAWLECIKLAFSVIFPSLPLPKLGLGACLTRHNTEHTLIYTYITSLPALNNSSISPSQNPHHHFSPGIHFLKRLQLATTWKSCHLSCKPRLVSTRLYKMSCTHIRKSKSNCTTQSASEQEELNGTILDLTTSSEQCHFLIVLLMYSIDILDLRRHDLCRSWYITLTVTNFYGKKQERFVPSLISQINCYNISSFRPTSDHYTFLQDAPTVCCNNN